MARDADNVIKRPTRSNLRRARRAFTLLELLIVIMILLALGGLVLVNLMGVAEQSDVDLQKVQFDQVNEAMKRFKLDMKRYPSEEEGLQALWNQEALQDEQDMNNWRGPYVENPVTEDQWGNELIYRNPSEIREDGSYDLVSVGPDGEEGTDDDITNHDRHLNEEGEMGGEFDDFSPPAPAGGGGGAPAGGAGG